MELKRKLRKVAASVLALTMGLSIGISSGACSVLEGQLKVQEFVANSTNMDTEYYVGETVNFDGLVLKAKYNDDNTKDVTVSQVMIKFDGQFINNNLSVLTESVGEKTIELIFEGKTVTITIVVTALPGGGDSSDSGSDSSDSGSDSSDSGSDSSDSGSDSSDSSSDSSSEEEEKPQYNVSSYTLPQSITARTRKMNNAGQEYGSDKYESTFYQATDKEVVVGDDNTYKFLPYLHTSASFVDDEVVEGQLITAFKTNTTISIYQNGGYVTLKRAEDATQVSYSLDGVVYATESVGKNEYDFTEAAVGAKFKLDVLPDECYVDPDYLTPWATPVSVEVKVVDAFNVYTAKQLAIIENLDTNWDSIKTEMGITADMVANVKGVVLQNDISILASDLPASFIYTIDKEIKYHTNTDGVKVEKTAQEWGLTNTFLKETAGVGAYNGVWERSVTAGQTFDIYGNYYLLDYSKMPLVSSLKTEDGNNYEDGYGSDFSNATLLRFVGAAGSMGNVTISDLDSIGNANRSQLLDEKERPVYAGGSIFMKMEYVNISFDNVINKTSFISFIPELTANLSLNNFKCFDSYQSVGHVWGSTINITNSTMERSGGPLFILQHVERSDIDYIPNVTVDAASKLNNLITGEEAWFHSIPGAADKVASIKGLSQLFMGNGKAVTDNGASGKLNLIAIVMREGTDTSVLSDVTAQGYFSYGDYVINRMADATVNPLRQVYDMVVDPTSGTTLLQAGSAIFNTTYQAIGYMPDATSFAFVNDAMAPTFLSGEYLTMVQGGLGVMLKFYNYNA